MIGFSVEDAQETWTGVGADSMPQEDWLEFIELCLTCKYVELPHSQFVTHLNNVLNEAQ